MATNHGVQHPARELLKAAEKLDSKELDQFLKQALLLRARRRGASLSGRETKLLTRINAGFPAGFWQRFQTLVGKRRKRTLTATEQKELLTMTDQVEALQVKRTAALVELAELREMSPRDLARQLQVPTPAVDG